MIFFRETLWLVVVWCTLNLFTPLSKADKVLLIIINKAIPPCLEKKNPTCDVFFVDIACAFLFFLVEDQTAILGWLQYIAHL